MNPDTVKSLFPTDLARAADGLFAKFQSSPFHLMPLKKTPTVADIRSVIPNGAVVVCDLYIEHIEKIGKPIRASDGTLLGYLSNGIVNIDHHAPVKELGPISSAVQAGKYRREFGHTLALNTPVLTHHTDCDSICSTLIMLGLLPGHEVIDRAVVAADHSCAPNPIADVLQEIGELQPEPGTNYQKEEWRRRRFSLGVLVLEQLLSAKNPEGLPLLTELRARRKAKRDFAADLFAHGEFSMLEGGDIVIVQSKIDSEFLPAVFPGAAIIVVGNPRADGSGKCNIRIRMGRRALERGITRFDLDLEKIDAGAGGRFNAGSNERAGGTNIPVDEYARYILERWRALSFGQ